MRKHILLGLLLCATAVHAAPFATYEEAMKESRRLYYAGDKTSALTAIQQAAELAKTPDNKAEALMRVARIIKEQGDPTKSLVIMKQVLQIQGVSQGLKQETQFLAASDMIKAGQFDEGRATLQPLLALPNPTQGVYEGAHLLFASSFVTQKKNEDALRELSSVVADEKIEFAARAMAQDLRGGVFTDQKKFDEARAAYQSGIQFLEEGAKTDESLLAQRSPLYLDIVQSYEKQYGEERAKEEALKLFTPVMQRASELRNATRYKKALPLYLSLNGIAPYLPGELFLLVKAGEGEMLMYGQQWDNARSFLRKATNAQLGAGGTEKWQSGIHLLQQMAGRTLALSFKLQGDTENNAEAYAQARTRYAQLLAVPDLNPAVRARIDNDMKGLPLAPPAP